ncbi:MAG: PilZ domain-containing protein [Candidatus Omnitrophica bacterium]|jgi:c-di-GMP-binding flagellar brake protein YcgR|nr:PilZ domain-containing protein [Candidatus Omnitrophota bacterium]
MDYQGMEKRRFVRAKFPCSISIHTLHEHIITTYTENISAGGVRVIIEEKLEMSSTVGLEVQINKNIIVCKGRIVWVVDRESPYKKGLRYHDTGIEFYEINENDRRVINDAIEEILKCEK